MKSNGNVRGLFVVLAVLLSIQAGMLIAQDTVQLKKSQKRAAPQQAGNDLAEPQVNAKSVPSKADDGAQLNDVQFVNVKQSNQSLKKAAAVTVYDFTDSADKYYGGATGAKDLGDGKWGMIAGDANGDGGVYAEDYTEYQINQGSTGYEPADYNMDGGVYAEDYTIYQLNQGNQTQVP